MGKNKSSINKAKINAARIMNKQLEDILFEFLLKFDAKELRLVRQSQIAQSTIYGSDKVVTQVLTPVILSLGSQLGLFLLSRIQGDETLIRYGSWFYCMARWS